MRVTATRSTWVSAQEGARDRSAGGQGSLTLKSLHEVALLGFEASPLRGHRVQQAALWMHCLPEASEAARRRTGLTDRPDCLRYVGVSTVGSDWEEATASYDHARTGVPWGYPGSKLWDVIFGNGHSQHCHGEREAMADGWWRLALPPELVEALAAGLAHGLAVQAETGIMFWLAPEVLLDGRSAGELAPYLEVISEPAPGAAPSPPRDLNVTPAAEYSSLATGAAQISLVPPESALGYRVTVNGAPLAPWRVPIAAPSGERQSFVVEDLPPEAALSISICAVDRAGRVSEPVRAAGQSSAALVLPPPLPEGPFHPAPGAPIAGERVRLWAFPEVTKVDPVTGRAMFEPATDLRPANAVWDGAAGRVRLAAARGEIVAFQLAVEATAPLQDVRVCVTDLQGPRSAIGPGCLRLYRVWYVPAAGDWHGEYAIPLRGGFALPAPDNAVPGQTLQSVVVDIAVPADAAPGLYRGRVSVVCAEESLSVPLEVVVYPVTIPAEMSFNAELNCYEPPGGRAGCEYFYEAHRLAHYHRCTLNTVAYGQTGTVTPGYAPEIRREGARVEVTDWRAFDRAMGPLLDGSAFAGSPRGTTPVRTFYLPFFEHWPLPLWDYYPYHGDPRDEAVLMRHAFEAAPIEEMFPPEYGAAMEAVAGEFVRHFEQKGWTGTDFQMYLNNKTHFGGTWWTLDEPADRPDWLANRYFAQFLKRGTRGARTVQFRFRGDISRPQWQYDLLDGLMDTIYYNNQIFDNPTAATRLMNRRIPDPHVYGHFNAVEAAHHGTALWCLKAAALGLNGALPWQSLGEASALRDPGSAGTNLIVPGELAGHPGPVASLRVLAARRGAQDVELLRLLGRREGYAAEQLGSIIAQKLDLAGLAAPQSVDEAAPVRFGQVSAQAFAELKEGVLLALSAG